MPDEERDAGIALPPALMRAVEAVDNRDEKRRLRGIGDVVELMRLVAARPEQVPLAAHAVGQRVATANARHL
ncbi:hypothetical protein D3C83_192090 [compost metagenome]